MADTIDVILDYLRRHQLPKAEAALRGELVGRQESNGELTHPSTEGLNNTNRERVLRMDVRMLLSLAGQGRSQVRYPAAYRALIHLPESPPSLQAKTPLHYSRLLDLTTLSSLSAPLLSLIPSARSRKSRGTSPFCLSIAYLEAISRTRVRRSARGPATLSYWNDRSFGPLEPINISILSRLQPIPHQHTLRPTPSSLSSSLLVTPPFFTLTSDGQRLPGSLS
ncbi:unnamed protein product [Victoria cruziana]